MAISQELVSIKSAGTYRREYDLSNMEPTYESTYSRGRIVPGFSYKGPFNKPYKITDSSQFISIYGGIDAKLESNGCFFHRTALEMLKEGPIIALNLHSYASNDKIVSGCAIGTKQATPFSSLIKGVFSTSLWYEPWPDRLADSWDDNQIVKQEDTKTLCDFDGDDCGVAFDNGYTGDYNVIATSSSTSPSSKYYFSINEKTPIGKVSLMKYKKEDDETIYSIDNSVDSIDIMIYAKNVYSESGITYTASVQDMPSNITIKIDNANDTLTLSIVEETGAESEETNVASIDMDKLVQDGIISTNIISTLEDFATENNEGEPFIYIANASGNDIRAYVYKTADDSSSMLAYNIPISDYYGSDIPYELQEYLDEHDLSASDYTLADFMFTVVIFNDVKTLSNDMISLKESWGLANMGDNLQFIREDDTLFECNGMDNVITFTGSSVPGLTNASGVDISIDTFLRNLASTYSIVGYAKAYCEKSTNIKKQLLETSLIKKIPVGAEPCAQNPDNYKAILNTLVDSEDTVVKYAVTERDAKTGKFNDEPSQAAEWGVTNMWKAITDRMVVSFRYLVDCWGYGIEASSKSIFAKICLKQHATGILNAPSALAFSKVNEFVGDFGNIDYKKVATSDTFTVPNISEGATHVGYFYPWNRKGSKLLPPAGVVSNLFLQKSNPWEVAAGTLRGALDNYNPEVPLSTKDREWLEAIGINAIIDANDDQHTICVYGNKTAKQKPVSALSALSFRDFVVYIMDEIESIIKPYVFSENTEAVRTEIVSKCTTFLKSVTATANRSGGLTAFEVIMDSTNNTAEIIDNFYGILDIKIEGARPMEKVVQRLYILPTGTLTSDSE